MHLCEFGCPDILQTEAEETTAGMQEVQRKCMHTSSSNGHQWVLHALSHSSPLPTWNSQCLSFRKHMLLIKENM